MAHVQQVKQGLTMKKKIKTMRSIDVANQNAKKIKPFGYNRFKEHEVNLTPKGTYKYTKKELKYIKDNGGLKKPEYTGKKGEYTKTKQGNWMKVHPLDRK